jgi:hypothetical protein
MPDIVDPTRHPEEDEAHRCQFCSYRGTLTREHVWPWALRRHFPEHTRAVHETGSTGQASAIPGTTWHAPAFTTRVKIDCHACNHDRLEKIERQAVPYIVPMARGVPAPGGLQLDAQRKVAAFALRMIAVGQYTHPQLRPVPRNHREHLMLNLSPPQRMEVWAFCCEIGDLRGAIHLQAGTQRLARPGERLPDWANAYRGILRIGHLVLELAARNDGQTFPAIHQDSRAFVRLWPVDFTRIGVWPPVRLLSEQEFEARLASFDEAQTVWPRPV